MRRTKLVTLLILFCIFTDISLAFSKEASDKDMSVIAEDLAKCGGMFLAMRDVMLEMNKQNAAKTFEDTSRGAYLSGAYLNFISEKMPDWDKAIAWGESLRDTTKNYWLGLVELHTLTEDHALPEEFMKELEFCTSLNPVQTEIVNIMKDAMYSQ